MNRCDWSRLNKLQVGKYAEYFTKMEFTLYGFDVYTSEVDDHGVDFVVRRKNGLYYDVQVKSIRGLNYVYFTKDKFPLENNFLAAVVILIEGKEPDLYLMRATEWHKPNDLFVGRDYEGKKSKPEWGINISTKNMPILEQYLFNEVVHSF